MKSRKRIQKLQRPCFSAHVLLAYANGWPKTFKAPSQSLFQLIQRGSSVGRPRDTWWGGPGFDSRCSRPLPTGLVGVSILWPAETEVMVYPLCHLCGSTYNFGSRPRCSLVVDEDVEKLTNQTDIALYFYHLSNEKSARKNIFGRFRSYKILCTSGVTQARCTCSEE